MKTAPQSRTHQHRRRSAAEPDRKPKHTSTAAFVDHRPDAIV